MAYSEQVLDHYNNPRNVGKFDPKEDNIGTGMVGAPACGDVMRLQIKVDDEVLTYAISRMERSFLFAKTLVEALDVESLKLKKPIKKNMVNEIIEKLYSRT